jgi:hypothetical protein
MSRLRRLARAAIPPVLWGGATRLYRTVSRRRAAPWSSDWPGTVHLPAGCAGAVEYVVGYPVFAVPTDRVRYPGGLAYSNDCHHFLQYYREGVDALRRFYASHQPANVLERHFLATPSGRQIPDRGTPWLIEPNDRLGGERGLGAEHGIQAFGPVSEEKLLLEAGRLDRVLRSLREHGFCPEFGGFPRGYFLIGSDGQWVVIVREGLHRVAAMSHLGFPTIPLMFHTAYPRTVRRDDWANWSLVRDGSLTGAEALSIFDRYFSTSPPAPPEP